jgi:hypothetical protein
MCMYEWKSTTCCRASALTLFLFIYCLPNYAYEVMLKPVSIFADSEHHTGVPAHRSGWWCLASSKSTIIPEGRHQTRTFQLFLSCWWCECAAALCDVCVVLNSGQIDLICSSRNKNVRADLIALLKITWWDADIDMAHSWASHLCMHSSSHGWGERERNLVIHIFIIFCCFLSSVHIVFDGVETWNLGLWCWRAWPCVNLLNAHVYNRC